MIRLVRMPRTEAAYQHIRAARKEQILYAAANVFARKGLAATTVTDIAAAAGMSHGLLYRHFASKEDVFAAVVEQALDMTKRLVQAALAQPGTPWEHLCWITTHLFPGEPLGKRPEYFLVVLHALTNEDVPAHVREQATQQGDLIYEVIHQFILEGQETGQVISGNPEQLATLYLSCVQGLVLRAAFSRRPGSTFPTMEAVLRILQAER